MHIESILEKKKVRNKDRKEGRKRGRKKGRKEERKEGWTDKPPETLRIPLNPSTPQGCDSPLKTSLRPNKLSPRGTGSHLFQFLQQLFNKFKKSLLCLTGFSSHCF